ncbi:MAG: class I SAM-dependent methyltransferase [Bacteroidota bacterium]
MEQEKDWFIDWFNSPYYHILYKNRDDKEAEKFLKNLSRSLGFHKEQRILDLACGKGRHSIYLNQKGYRVTGLDLSEENIREASSHANPTLDFHVHDMREVYPSTFNFILNLFTSFGYFNCIDDNIRVLKSCREMLAWDGRLVIDFLNAHALEKQLIPHEIKEIDGIEFQIRKRMENGLIEKTISFSDMGKDFEFREQVQALTLTDFRKLFTAAGFELINTFGDYQLNPYQPDNSPRLILVAKSTAL